MVIQGIASSYQSPASQNKTSGSSIVGKDEFLKLMITQLKNQDPLNPTDGTEYTAQLAQFSSLEQLININQNLENQSTQDSLSSRVSAAGFIGKSVRVSGSNLSLNGGTPNTIRYDLKLQSKETSINVYNTAGDLVDVVTLGKLDAGTHEFKWDGELSSGKKAADGAYRYEVVAVDAEGNRMSVTGNTTGTVTGVKFDSKGQPLLEVGGATYGLGSVLAIGSAA